MLHYTKQALCGVLCGLLFVPICTLFVMFFLVIGGFAGYWPSDVLTAIENTFERWSSLDK